MSKPFPPGSPAHLMWGVRAWKVLTKCGPLRGSENRHTVRVKQLGDLLRRWCLRAPLIVIAQAHRFREGPHFILELKKGLKAFRLPREIWVKWGEVNLAALMHKSLGHSTQFAILLLLMVSRRFLQLWASSLLFLQSVDDFFVIQGRGGGGGFPWYFWLG